MCCHLGVYIFFCISSQNPQKPELILHKLYFENQCFLFHSSTGSLLNLVYVDKTVKSKLMALDYYPRLENYRYIMTSFNILVKRSERESRSLNNREFYCLGVQKIIRIRILYIYLIQNLRCQEIHPWKKNFLRVLFLEPKSPVQIIYIVDKYFNTLLLSQLLSYNEYFVLFFSIVSPINQST